MRYFESRTNLVATAICLSQLTWATSAAAVDVLARAVAGSPYGVATIEIPLVQPIVGQTLPPIQATDAGADTATASGAGRVLYSFSEDIKVDVPRPSETPVPRPGNGRLLGRLGNLIREIADPGPPQSQTVARRVTFLFVGSTPLRIHVGDGLNDVGTYELVPEADAVALDAMKHSWWEGYTAAIKSQVDAGDYPTWVEDYLIAMLSRRTRSPLPTWYTNLQSRDDELLDALKLVAGASGTSEAIFRRSAIGYIDASGRPLPEATLPLPPAPRWSPLFNDPSLIDVPVEPMAQRVPPECFYIRYGSFENYLWFADLSTQYGGDVSSMVTLRGIKIDTNAKIQSQLNLKMTDLSRVLGQSVIADQAVIGRDLFVNDGASLGVLLQAKNTFLLRSSLTNDRSKLARTDPEVSLKEVDIEGRTISLLSTADNRVRSYMVEDGDFFLVTNSKTLVKRFLEVGDSGQSLATTPSFKLARKLMPIERNDTLFAYFSPEMLRGLVSPEYLIELRRRIAAGAEVAMMHLAMSAADQEARITGEPLVGLDSLIDAGFLPAGFGSRPDGSGAINVGEQVMDTRRGRRGFFMPIVDGEIDAVTPDEVAWYQRIAAEYETRFPTIDPIMVGIRRESIAPTGQNVEPGERITVHAEVAPMVPEKYGKYAEYLGPPTRVAMQFASDDIIAVQAHVASDELGAPTHLFAAVKDTIPPEPQEFEGLLNIYRALRDVPGYLGAGLNRECWIDCRSG